ncbi:MAG TPA: hypothetical protein VIL74_09080 [Pyrinomonadaceae bacterium]|jgi:hypothetical protein
MAVIDSPFTDPETIEALYAAPDDETLQAEIAMLTGQTYRDAVNAAIAQTNAGGAGAGGAGGSAVGSIPKIVIRKSTPDDLDR